MRLTEILRMLSGKPDGTGLFAYAASRNANKSRVELEKARREASAALISQLPNGAVFREGTADGWREIWMPLDPSLILLPATDRQPAGGMDVRDAIAAQNRKALSGEGSREPGCVSAGSQGEQADPEQADPEGD